MLGHFDHPAGDEVDDQDQDPGVKGDEQQLGQTYVEKFLHVGEPFLIEAADKRRGGLRPSKEGGKWQKGGVHWHPMMLLERWAVAVAVGMCLVSTGGAPGQSQASPDSQNTQQTQQNQNQNQDKNNADTDDAEPAEFHPPAEIGQPAESSPAVESHPSQNPPAATPAPPPVESPAAARPPAQVGPAAQPAPPPPPDPPLSTDPVERQLQIDTAHLLQLTQDLKAELDKAGNNTLSLAALRKADEVQKLAKELKERMKDREQVIQSKP
jgi:hypothetical protein